MEITRYQRVYGPQVAQHHRLALPNGFLSQLGDGFLSELYGAIDQDSRSGVWIALDENRKLVGFLSGTASVKACYRTVLWRHWPKLIVHLLPSLASITTLKRLLETTLYPFRSSSGDSAAAAALQHPGELLSIAVSENARGKGVGRQLVDAFEKALGNWGYRGEYRVATDSSDPLSNRFYLAMGFQSKGNFRHHENTLSVYTKTVHATKNPTGAGSE